jgi:hypothetical protein
MTTCQQRPQILCPEGGRNHLLIFKMAVIANRCTLPRVVCGGAKAQLQILDLLFHIELPPKIFCEAIKSC